MAYREQQEHLEARLRTLEAEAERKLTEADTQAAERRRRARADAKADHRELERLRRENARLERLLSREREDFYGGRALVYGALGVGVGALLAIGIWFALSSLGLVLCFVVLAGLFGAGLGYFFER